MASDHPSLPLTGQIREEVLEIGRLLFPKVKSTILQEALAHLALQQHFINQLFPNGTDDLIQASKRYPIDQDKQGRFIMYTIFQLYNINNLGSGMCCSDQYMFDDHDIQKGLDRKHGTDQSTDCQSPLVSISDIKKKKYNQVTVSRFNELHLVHTIDTFMLLFDDLIHVEKTKDGFLCFRYFLLYCISTPLGILKKNTSRRLKAAGNKEQYDGVVNEIHSILASIITSSGPHKNYNNFVQQYTMLVDYLL